MIIGIIGGVLVLVIAGVVIMVKKNSVEEDQSWTEDKYADYHDKRTPWNTPGGVPPDAQQYEMGQPGCAGQEMVSQQKGVPAEHALHPAGIQQGTAEYKFPNNEAVQQGVPEQVGAQPGAKGYPSGTQVYNPYPEVPTTSYQCAD